MESYFFSILVVFLVFSGVTGGLGVLIYMGVPKRRPSDASHLNLTPPANSQTSVEKLISLGFHRLGETYLRMPLAMSPGPTWIFVNEQANILAEIVEISPGAYFTTVFSDGSVVETGYPQGEDISTTDFLSQTVTTNIDNAYQLHLQCVDEFKTHHGEPQAVKNIQDYLLWDGLYRTRHAQRKMRRVFIIDLAQVIALIYGIVASIVVWQLWLRHAPVPAWFIDWDRGLFLLLAPAFTISVLSIIINIQGSRRNRKRARAALQKA